MSSSISATPPATPWNRTAQLMLKLERWLTGRIYFVDNQPSHVFAPDSLSRRAEATRECDARRKAMATGLSFGQMCKLLGSGAIAARCGEISILVMQWLIEEAVRSGNDMTVAVVDIGTVGGHRGNHSFVLCSSNGEAGAEGLAKLLSAAPVLVPAASAPSWGTDVTVFDLWVSKGECYPFAATDRDRWVDWLRCVRAQAGDDCIAHCMSAGAGLPLSVAYTCRTGSAGPGGASAAAFAEPSGGASSSTGGTGGGGGCCVIM